MNWIEKLKETPTINLRVAGKGQAYDRTYLALATTAPADYDGFGTFTLEDEWTLDMLLPGPQRSHPNGRVVLIDADHFEWQVQRYASGGNIAIEPVDTLMTQAFITRLLLRLQGKQSAE